MSRNRSLVVLLVALGGILAGLGGWALTRCSRAPFTEDIAGHIHPGMTEAEVVAILGCPPGNYSGGRACCVANSVRPFWINPQGGTSWLGDGVEKGWIGGEGAIGVEFGRDGKVACCWYEDVFVAGPPPFLEQLRAAVQRLFR